MDTDNARAAAPLLDDNAIATNVPLSSRSNKVHTAGWRHTITHENDEGMRRVTPPICCGGIVDDCVRRSRHCTSDYADAMRHLRKTISASLFMFFATFFSTIALGALVQKTTKCRIGLFEYLLMNSCAGVAHSIVGAQPLLVLRPTGPITAIIEKLSILSDTLQLNFYQYFAATGACVGLLMAITAALELSRHIRRVTPFVADVFACFVCSIYLSDGVSDVSKRFSAPGVGFGEALLEMNLALLTFGVSLLLFWAPSWGVLPMWARTFLADYAVTLAVVCAALVTAAITVVDVQRIPLATDFGPTCWHNATEQGANSTTPSATLECAASGTVRRAWLPWSHAPAGQTTNDLLKLWAVALCSAVPITFFFFMDQNISSLLCQLPSMGLRKGRYFHVSFLAMGAFCAAGPFLGLPFVTGSLPHSPQFVKALTSTVAPSAIEGTAAGTNRRRIVVSPSISVAENRVAPIVTYALLASPLVLPWLLRPIPEAAIDGVLAYVGVEGILGTQLWRRTLLLLSSRDEMPTKLLTACNQRAFVVHAYTVLQLLALAVVWAVNLAPYGLGLCVSFGAQWALKPLSTSGFCASPTAGSPAPNPTFSVRVVSEQSWYPSSPSVSA